MEPKWNHTGLTTESRDLSFIFKLGAKIKNIFLVKPDFNTSVLFADFNLSLQ